MYCKSKSKNFKKIVKSEKINLSWFSFDCNVFELQTVPELKSKCKWNLSSLTKGLERIVPICTVYDLNQEIQSKCHSTDESSDEDDSEANFSSDE